MTDSFPRQQAKTQWFSLGVPRSFQISPDGSRVAFLRSQGGDDPVTCLWLLDVGTGQERLVADPAKVAASGAAITDQERAIRERTHERAAGIPAARSMLPVAIRRYAPGRSTWPRHSPVSTPPRPSMYALKRLRSPLT